MWEMLDASFDLIRFKRRDPSPIVVPRFGSSVSDFNAKLREHFSTGKSFVIGSYNDSEYWQTLSNSVAPGQILKDHGQLYFSSSFVTLTQSECVL